MGLTGRGGDWGIRGWKRRTRRQGDKGKWAGIRGAWSGKKCLAHRLTEVVFHLRRPTIPFYAPGTLYDYIKKKLIKKGKSGGMLKRDGN
jgi:hypothetical protein